MDKIKNGNVGQNDDEERHQRLLDRVFHFDEEDRKIVKASLAAEDAHLWQTLARDGSISPQRANELMPEGFRLDENLNIVGTERVPEPQGPWDGSVCYMIWQGCQGPACKLCPERIEKNCSHSHLH